MYEWSGKENEDERKDKRKWGRGKKEGRNEGRSGGEHEVRMGVSVSADTQASMSEHTQMPV